MIAFLHGILADKKPNRIVLDVSGVGYEVGISTQTYAGLPELGSELRLLTYHHITESEQRLFGFMKSEEKSLFELLITVKGVGPRLALTILSGLPSEQIASALASGDAAMLARTPGIGKKTAERMVLELRDKVAVTTESTSSGRSAGMSGGAGEAVSALEALGFKRSDAESAVNKVMNEQDGGKETGDLVRSALQLLYR